MPKAKSGIKSRPTKRNTGVGSKGVTVKHGVGGGRVKVGLGKKIGVGVSIPKGRGARGRIGDSPYGLRKPKGGYPGTSTQTSVPRKPTRKPSAIRRGR